LLLLFELKAGNLQDVEKAVAHHAGNGIIHPEKALSKPGWYKNNKRRSNDSPIQIKMHKEDRYL